MSAALRMIVEAVDANDRNNELIRRRAEHLLERRAQGASWGDAVRGEEPPLIVELLSQNMNRHAEVGGALRRAEAAALHADGLTMEAIADLFGVTRQRISQLLKSASSRPRL